MFDTIRLIPTILKNEINKTPEKLKKHELDQAKQLASIFTLIRKMVYFLMPSLGIAVAIMIITEKPIFNNYIIPNIFWILFGIYIIFKLRDLVRGNI